ncbi:MAG: helix-turn-helix domain-containing protein [Halanaeroarchaeum sp.]
MSKHAVPQRFKERVGERDVQVVLEIRPKGSCFMDHLEGDIADIELHFPEGQCHADVTVCDGDGDERNVEIFNHTGDLCVNCPGVIFSEYDAVPRFLNRTNEMFVVQTYLPLDHRLSELVEDLRTVSESVRVLRIIHNREMDVDDQTAEVDLSQMTNKQRQALERAVEMGYYASPPSVSLEELAREFGVSSSAMSQRITRAEKHVMEQLFS